MAKGHSYLWRKPGRRDEERRKFSALMKKIEARRLKLGMSKAELAAELGTTDDAVRAWLTGRTVGRKETVAKIEAFLKTRENVPRSRQFLHEVPADCPRYISSLEAYRFG